MSFCNVYAEASANVLEDYVERSQRPVMTSEQAVVKLLDARGILYELKVSFWFHKLQNQVALLS